MNLKSVMIYSIVLQYFAYLFIIGGPGGSMG
jgi:hypothetical protein